MALAAFCGITAALPTHAIVISAGTADSSYIDLGNSAAYRSVGQIYGTDSGGGGKKGPKTQASDFRETSVSVPEPGSLALLGLGIAALARRRRRR